MANDFTRRGERPPGRMATTSPRTTTSESDARTTYRRDPEERQRPFEGGMWPTDPLGLTGPVNDLLFGRPGSTELIQAGTLTPEQQALLQQLIAAGPQAAPQVEGARVSADQLSLAGQEQLLNQLAQAGGIEALQRQAAGADPEELRRQLTERVAPLQEQAQEQLKTVGREFGSSGFYGSDREAADQRVQEAFAQAQGQVMADLVSAGEERALQAATQLGGLQLGASQTEMQGQIANMNAQLQAAIQTGDNEQAARIQNAISTMQMQQLYQQLLGVQGVENIVLEEPGTQGQGGQVAGGILGAIFSDARLKYDIRPVAMLPIGIPLVTWRWKHSGKPSCGVIAQQLREVLPQAVIEINGYLAVNYNLLCQVLSRFWTK